MYRVKLGFRKFGRNSSYYSCAYSSLPSFYPVPLDLNPPTSTTTESTLAASSCGLGGRGRINLYPPWVKDVIMSLDDDIGRQLKFHNLYPRVKSAMASLDGDVAHRLKFLECVKSYGFSHSVDTFARLIGIYSSATMYGEVRWLFLTVAVFCKSYDWKLLLVLLYEVVRLSKGSITLPQAYEYLIQALAESSWMHMYALAVLFDAMEEGIEVGAPLCNFVLEWFVDRNGVEEARTLFSWMSAPNLYTFTLMIDLYTKAGQFDLDDAEDIFFQMEISGVSPNEVTYGLYLRGLCFVDRVECAWELLCELQQQEIREGWPHRRNYYSNCYNVVMFGFCDRGDMDGAMLVLTRMKDCWLSPDVHSYTLLIHGFCNKGDVVNGYKLFQEMIGCGIMPTLDICSSLVGCSRGAGDAGKTKQKLEDYIKWKNEYYVRCISLPWVDLSCPTGQLPTPPSQDGPNFVFAAQRSGCDKDGDVTVELNNT